jgi:hypothetical protein
MVGLAIGTVAAGCIGNNNVVTYCHTGDARAHSNNTTGAFNELAGGAAKSKLLMYLRDRTLRGKDQEWTLPC